MGDTITEADVRLFTTLARFDAVYHGHFKCNRNKLIEMPALWGYARDLFQTPGFGDTIDFDQIKQHYYVVHTDINPTGIVPKGPDADASGSPRTGARRSADGRSATARHPGRRSPVKRYPPSNDGARHPSGSLCWATVGRRPSNKFRSPPRSDSGFLPPLSLAPPASAYPKTIRCTRGAAPPISGHSRPGVSIVATGTSPGLYPCFGDSSR